MKTILFPTDFSSDAAETFKYAADIAFFFKARLIIMHVVDKPNFQIDDKALNHTASIVSDNMLQLVNDNLSESYNEKVKIEYYSVSGTPADAILDFSLKEGVELIVMGMKGHTNALDVLIGSNTLKVLSDAECPVLMIPNDAKFEGIDNLVFTTNFEFRDLQGIGYLKKWSTVFQAPIYCVHVVEKNENENTAAKNMQILRTTFKHHKRLYFGLAKGNLEDEIESYAKAKRADIIGMMTHKRNFISRQLEIGNTVKGIARKIPVPLLVIKDNAYEIQEGADWLKLINAIG